MKKHLIFVLLTFLPLCALASAIDGDWSGKLDLGRGRTLRIVLHIDGPEVTMDSPDQGAYGLKCETLLLSADSVSISIPKLYLQYSAKLQGDTLAGTFKQAHISLPLHLERGYAEPPRPQTPQPPFPYTEEPVKISNADKSITLAGTLTIPRNPTGSTPVVVLVTGSGAQNRDEELFGHKPFAVIADYLARQGVASLRYDDRGFAESIGDCSTATTADFAADARMVIDWLRSQNRFGKVGLIGHSEGGLIAYMLAAEAGGPDLIVSIAGPAVAGATILDYQNKQALMRSGIPEAQAEEQAANARRRLENDPAQVWFQYFLKYNPADALRSLKSPALIIYGEKDRQVPPSLNYDIARQLAPTATVVCYPGLNHLMQHAPTGSVEEYNEIEETIAPQVLQDITTFITTL